MIPAKPFMRISFSFYSERINAITKKKNLYYILMLPLSVILIILLQQDNFIYYLHPLSSIQ